MQQFTSQPTILYPYADRRVRRQRRGYYADYFAKRVLDITIVLFSLLTLWPLLLVISVLIKLDSKGSIFFVQERVGAKRCVKGGKVGWEIQNFLIYKFRTMVQNADQSVHAERVKAYVAGTLVNDNEQSKAQFKTSEDPRITHIGRFLRKTSLDELPQLFNVLKGEMSLVGPRPVPVYEAALYQEPHYERLTALPGITGLWQVKGRADISFDEMIRLDLEYVRTRSIWLDLWILLMTIPSALGGRGAA